VIDPSVGLHPRDCLDELGLTVSVDTGDAEHLACTEFEGDPRHRLNAAVVVGVDLGHLKDAVARLLRRRRRLHQHLAADHHLRKILTGHVCGRDRPNVDAVAEDVISSAADSASPSLCEMKMIVFPCSVSSSKTPYRSSTS